MTGSREAVTAEFDRPEVRQLGLVLTEATGARRDSFEFYIRPVGADDAEAEYHHFIFGQRGSGKSSLMRNLEYQCKESGKGYVWIDQRIFTDLEYPDVLISCVLQILEDLSTSIENKQGEGDSGRWKRIALRLSLRPLDELSARLAKAIENFRILKQAPLDATIAWTYKIATTDAVEALGSVKVGALGGSGGAKSNASREITSTQTVVTKKGEYLERALTDLRRLLQDCAHRLGGGFIFVDDLYLIAKSKQPRVVGYLHRLVKDSGFWLKIGSIRYLTNNFIPGDPPVGMQERHDAHVVPLDRQFNHFDTTKGFLEEILSKLAGSVDIDPKVLFTDGARERLVLAAGGVPRDYLLLVREAIEEARERGITTKTGSHRVGVEDVNAAAGRIAPGKLEDLKRDTPSEADVLERRVIDLTNFCRTRKSAYFLIDSQDHELMNELSTLQHLRFAHLLYQSETIPDRSSQRFNVYLLDIAQLSYQRATQGVDIDGWRTREKRRNRKLVYTNDWATPAVPKKPTTTAKSPYLF